MLFLARFKLFLVFTSIFLLNSAYIHGEINTSEIVNLHANSFFDAVFNSSEEIDRIPVINILDEPEYRSKKQKDWTIIFYMAADNDLQKYAIRNIRQMSTIGSTEQVNIIAHLDIKSGNKKICSRFYVDKNKILEFNPGAEKMDSGDAQTLISAVTWGIQRFPASNYMLIFWDHGTGIVDPTGNRIARATDLFSFNPVTHKFELDRSVDFLELVNAMNPSDSRGVCWDDSTGHYLTNQKIVYALQTLKDGVMEGKKFNIIGFDTCLMSMVEIADMMKDYADFMVSSQEVELGTGWNYQSVFFPFVRGSMQPRELARHIVNVYESTYGLHTNDYTLSAVDLTYVNDLVVNLNTVTELLMACLQLQQATSVKTAITLSRSRRLCTHFDTPQYIDLHHFYRNLMVNIKDFKMTNEQEGTRLKKALQAKLTEGKNLIERMVFANVTGKNLSQAKGLSVYFPEQRIHPSYEKTIFAGHNAWPRFLQKMIA
jgi:hypothetical protein